MYWFLFSTITHFGCLHQPSQGRHQLTKRVKGGEASPYKQWCKIVVIIKL